MSNNYQILAKKSVTLTGYDEGVLRMSVNSIRVDSLPVVSWDANSLTLHSPEAEIRRQTREHRGRVQDCIVIVVPVEKQDSKGVK